MVGNMKKFSYLFRLLSLKQLKLGLFVFFVKRGHVRSSIVRTVHSRVDRRPEARQTETLFEGLPWRAPLQPGGMLQQVLRLYLHWKKRKKIRYWSIIIANFTCTCTGNVGVCVKCLTLSYSEAYLDREKNQSTFDASIGCLQPSECGSRQTKM